MDGGLLDDTVKLLRRRHDLKAISGPDEGVRRTALEVRPRSLAC